MRRTLLSLFALLLAAPAAAQPAGPPAGPPHAFLFGTWTGGIFPVPAGMTREACLAQPIVIITKDLVMRATITELTLTQREIETARGVPGGVEFRFQSGVSGSRMLGGYSALAGFGCETPDILHVQRRGENEIAFPGCADFPNPLVRCH